MEEMSQDEMVSLAREAGLGHLCLARGGDAYGIPLFYAFDGKTFFFQSHPGLKDEFADTTIEACLVITHALSADEWRSVQVFGPLERQLNGSIRLRAVDALMRVPFPPSAGFSPHGVPRRDELGVYVWALTPTRWSGHKSVPIPA